MQIKIFSIPLLGGEAISEEMNVFLRSKKVLQVKEQLVESPREGVFWSFCIKYTDDINLAERDRSKVDYKEVLDDATFKKFSALREIRKRIANEEKIAAYLIFTDAELAEMAKMDIITDTGLKSIKGIGDKKLEKYGTQFITAPTNEAGR